MIPPKFQIVTVLMFNVLLIITLLGAIDHWFYVFLLPYVYLAYEIYYRK